MKKVFTFLSAGILGGLVVVFSNYFLTPNSTENTLNETYVKAVNEPINAVTTGPDFSQSSLFSRV